MSSASFGPSPIEVAAAVILHDEKVLLAKRTEGDLKGLWEFPGGKIEPGETWAAAAERELLEELHLEVKADKRLVVLEHEYPQKRVRLHFILCHLPSPAHKQTVMQSFQNVVEWFDPFGPVRLELCPADKIALSYIPWKDLLGKEKE